MSPKRYFKILEILQYFIQAYFDFRSRSVPDARRQSEQKTDWDNKMMSLWQACAQ